MAITTKEYKEANKKFRTNIVDDDFVEAYKKLVSWHLEQKLGDDMRKLLEENLKEAQEKPEAFKSKWDTQSKGNKNG